MKHEVVSATEFKAKCLALLDDVGHNGGTITVTKRGRPLAVVGPAPARLWKSPESAWAGKVDVSDERLMADRSDRWEVASRKKRSR